MANERIKTEVLEKIGDGLQPHPVGRSKWLVRNQVVHVRFVKSPASGSEYGFNVNANTLNSHYELWICGNSQDYYLLPIKIVQEMYDHPGAYVDRRNPNLKIDKVNLENHLCRYARGGLKMNLEACYRGRVSVQGSETTSEMSTVIDWTENLIRYALRKHRKREWRLRESIIRDSMAQNNGHLRCEVPKCEFDFANRYGDLGYGFAHVHHNIPLASSDEPVKPRLEDLTVVCPNCHAMIQRWMRYHPDEICMLDRLIVTA